MTIICFKAKLFKIGSWTLLCLPKSASEKLPTRGAAMVRGTINGAPFQVALEPDGKGSHWFRVSETLCEAVGDTVMVQMEPTSQWPELELPADIAPIEASPAWMDITPAARWDWIRWINSASLAETRRQRIKRACDMLKAGKRRPCCFNRNLCTETYVSKNGVLLDRLRTS